MRLAIVKKVVHPCYRFYLNYGKVMKTEPRRIDSQNVCCKPKAFKCCIWCYVVFVDFTANAAIPGFLSLLQTNGSLFCHRDVFEAPKRTIKSGVNLLTPPAEGNTSTIFVVIMIFG